MSTSIGRLNAARTVVTASIGVRPGDADARDACAARQHVGAGVVVVVVVVVVAVVVVAVVVVSTVVEAVDVVMSAITVPEKTPAATNPDANRATRSRRFTPRKV